MVRHEDFGPAYPWQRYARPEYRRKAYRGKLADLGVQLRAMAGKLEAEHKQTSDFAGAVVKLREQVRAMGAVPAA